MVLNKNSQLKDLKEVLVSCGIDYSCWGKGSTKSLEQLFQEIQSGDCILHYSSDKIIRSVSVVTVDIFFLKRMVLCMSFSKKSKYLVTDQKKYENLTVLFRKKSNILNLWKKHSFVWYKKKQESLLNYLVLKLLF